MSAQIIISREQVQAIANAVAETNDAASRGYSVERVESVLITPAGETLSAALLSGCGDNVETLQVRSDGLVTKNFCEDLVTVRIENHYSDGHQSQREVLIPGPADGQDSEEWFSDDVFEHTGDGHGIDNDLGTCFVATVLAAANEALVGRSFEWTS